MKKNIMSEEAFNELIDGFEYVNNLTDYGRKNIKYHVQKLQQENKQLKSIIYELREHMLDIDYKMAWQYVEYLDRLLPEKILKEVSDE